MPQVRLNATAGIQSGWFDKDVAKRLERLPEAERDSRALDMAVETVHGVGSGSQASLDEALNKDTATVRDFLRFMGRSDAAPLLEQAAARRRVSAQIVGKLYGAYNKYHRLGLDG